MADTITIEGVTGYNGEYPLDITYFTNRELHLIKEVSGVRAGELTEAFNAGDNDLMVAIAVIAIWRKKGEKPNVDALWDSEAGKFTFNMEAPEETPEDESVPLSIEPDANATRNGQPRDAGETSRDTSDHQENVLRAIGTQV